MPDPSLVIARSRFGWRAGNLGIWTRTPAGWVGVVLTRTGPPVFTSVVDFIPAADVKDAIACLTRPAARPHWLPALLPLPKPWPRAR